MNEVVRDEHQMEIRIGKLLRTGVALAAAVTAIGGILLILREGMTPVISGRFRHEPVPFAGMRDLALGVLHGEPGSIIILGVVLLIATPIARVAATLVAFASQRDRTYVVVAALVLGVLLYGLLAGAGLG